MNFSLFISRLLVLSVLLILISFSSLHAQNLQWSSGYPRVVAGATSVTIPTSLTTPGNVYYLIFSEARSSITSMEIKNYAQQSNALQGLIARGIVPVVKGSSDTSFTAKVSENKTYYIYGTAESQGGELLSDQKVFTATATTAIRHQPFQYPSKVIEGGVIGYYVYFPEGYYLDTNRNYPAIIYLHGAGAKAKSPVEVVNLEDLTSRGLTNMIHKGTELPFIVISPQTPYDWNGNKEPGALVKEVVEEVTSVFRIDPSRLYLTGSSMGADGVNTYYHLYPEKVAAVVTTDGYSNSPADLCKVKDVPIWAFHNQYDDTIGVGGDQSMIDMINNCQPPPVQKARLTIYPDQGHNSFVKAFYDLTGSNSVYQWLLSQVKGNTGADSNNRSPWVYAGKDLQVKTGTERVSITARGEDPEGKTLTYSWKKISGPAVTAELKNETLLLSGLSEGTYQFTVTVADDGGRTSFDDVTVSVNDAVTATEDHHALTFQISPNPFVEELFLSGTNNISKGSLELTDLAGNPIPFEITSAQGGRVALRISRSDYIGICFLRRTDQMEGTMVFRVLKL